jgi:hypothetical protein
MDFESYEEAEVWILDHQLGRRNLLNHHAVRRIRGQLYNRLKTKRENNLRRGTSPKDQIDTSGENAAEKVAKKSGVGVATVKRDGARVKTIEQLSQAAKIIAQEASDKDIKALAKLSESDQNIVARAVRVGDASSIKEAIKVSGVKAPQSKKPRKPQKKLDRPARYQQWYKANGPIVKLVDTIGREVNEMHGRHHKAVKAAMQRADDQMAQWMGVER